MLESLHGQPIQIGQLRDCLGGLPPEDPLSELKTRIPCLERIDRELRDLNVQVHEAAKITAKINEVCSLLSRINEETTQRPLSRVNVVCNSLLSRYTSEALFWNTVEKGNGLLRERKVKEALDKYTEALLAAGKNRLKESLCMLKIKDTYLFKAFLAPKDFIIAATLCNYAFTARGYDRNSLALPHSDFGLELAKLERCLYTLLFNKKPDPAALIGHLMGFRESIADFRKAVDSATQRDIKPAESSKKPGRKFADVQSCKNRSSNPSGTKKKPNGRATQTAIKAALMAQVTLIQNIIGQAPCTYALVGFGSLANEEASPYSDLEFGILLQEDSEENKEYFRKLTFLLYIRVINLGETIVRAVKIPCLEKIDFFDGLTPRGFSFDGEGVPGKGCKTPLGNGNFELIQTPEQMADYIKGQWIEAEPHLPLELLNFTLIGGASPEGGAAHESLLSSYEAALKSQLGCTYQNMTVREYLAKKHLFDEDEATFDMSIDAPYYQGALVHLKKDLYRLPRLLIDRITLLEFGKISGSYLDKLAALAKPDAAPLNPNDLEAFQKAISATNFLRLTSYSKTQSQKDLKDPAPLRGQRKTDPAFVLSPMEKASCMYSYKPLFAFSSMAIEYLKGCRGQISSEPETAADRLALKILAGLRWGTSVRNDIKEAMKRHPTDMRTWALAGEYYRKTNLKKAANCLRKAMVSAKKQIDLCHIQVSLAEIYLLQNCYEKAYPLVKAAYIHYLADQGLKKKAQFIIIFVNLIAVSIAQRPKNLDLLKMLLVQGEAISELSSSQNYPFEKAALYVNLSALCRALHFECESQLLLEKWKQYAQRALNRNAALYSADHPAYANALLAFGLYLQAEGSLPEALTYLKQANEIYLNNPDTRFNANRQNVKAAIDQIVQLLKALAAARRRCCPDQRQSRGPERIPLRGNRALETNL